jgi:hypothetical protein
MRKNTTYKISITDAGAGQYRTTGSAVLIGAHNPMRAAAAELLAHGADPASKLAADWHGCTISPATIASLARPYRAPKINHRTDSFGRNVD